MDSIKANTPIMMLSVMLFSVLGTMISLYVYFKTTYVFLFHISIILGAIVIHFMIMFISAPIVFLLFRKKFNYTSVWFAPKKFEAGLYKMLKVKNWKNKVPVYDIHEYSLEKHPLEEIIMNTCHAEVVHEVILVVSYVPILLGGLINHYKLIILTSIVFSCCHLIFIVIQRFNRPRIIKLYESRKNR